MSCSCVLGIQRIRPLNLLLSSTKFKTYVTTVGQKFPKTSVEMNNFRKTLKIFNSSFSTRQLETAFSRRLNMMSRTMPSKGVQMGPSHDKANRILFRMLSGNNQYRKKLSEKHKSVAMYALSLAILIGGGSYAAVPLYRLYCQASGYGGTVRVADIGEKIETMEKQKHRVIKVKFNADKGATMRWSFRPQQAEIKIVPGETALAFYTAKNPTDVPITGISTYNVIPFEAGQYFNKIQCFCFEEQRLNPGEEVDMPVFFYIDPEFVDDPYLTKVNEITLSYTFFEAKDISWPDLQKYANK